MKINKLLRVLFGIFCVAITLCLCVIWTNYMVYTVSPLSQQGIGYWLVFFIMSLFTVPFMMLILGFFLRVAFDIFYKIYEICSSFTISSNKETK